MIMDNIATQLTQLQTIKQDIATAIEGKGGTVGTGFDTYATAISNIPSGGGGTPQIRLSENPDLKFGYSTFHYVPNCIIVDILYDYLFKDCTNLYEVTIPRVSYIPDNTFENCARLSNITIPDSVTEIRNYAFAATGLTSVTIPNSVTSIGSGAFQSCQYLASVTIPNSVTSIGDYVFYDNAGLTSVTIPNSVTSIGEYAFQGCYNLTSVTLPRNQYLFGDYFNYQHMYIFAGTGLTSVTIPGEIEHIPDHTFDYCASLSSVTIEEGITIIGDGAFYSCPLESVVIPSTVTSINNYAFKEGLSCQWVKCLPVVPPGKPREVDPAPGEEDTSPHFDDGVPIYVPDQSLTAYQNSPYWSIYDSNIKPMSDFATDFPNA